MQEIVDVSRSRAAAGNLQAATPRVRSTVPLPSSTRIKRNLLFTARRWGAAAFVLLAATIYTEVASVEAACETSREYLILGLWVIVVTCRIAVGAMIRFTVWHRWDVFAAPDQQLPSIYIYIRTEFILTLLSVLWTTIGFMYVYGSASACSNTPLARYATALVILLYTDFLLPVVLSMLLKLAAMCGCSCAVMLLQRAVLMGALPSQQTPAATANQIRALPECKYTAGMLQPDKTTCAICMSEYQSGEALRLLPCSGQHAFHKACIDTWLAIHANCPVCRTSMLEPPANIASVRPSDAAAIASSDQSTGGGGEEPAVRLEGEAHGDVVSSGSAAMPLQNHDAHVSINTSISRNSTNEMPEVVIEMTVMSVAETRTGALSRASSPGEACPIPDSKTSDT